MSAQDVHEQAQKRRRSIVLILLLSLLTALSLGSGGLAFYFRFQDTTERRAAQQALNVQFKQHDMRQTQAWHIVFCDAEQQIKKSAKIPEQQKTDAINFYDRELQRLGAAPCGGGT